MFLVFFIRLLTFKIIDVKKSAFDGLNWKFYSLFHQFFNCSTGPVLGQNQCKCIHKSYKMDTFLCSICKKCIPYLKLLYGTVRTVNIPMLGNKICANRKSGEQMSARPKVQVTKIYGTKFWRTKSRNKSALNKILSTKVWGTKAL